MGWFWKSTPLQTDTAARLIVQFYHIDMPTSLAVWVHVVPSEAMQHAVHLGHDSWMRCHDRSNRNLAPRGDNRVVGDLTLSYLGLDGAVAYVADRSAPRKNFRPLHADSTGISISCDRQPVEGRCFSTGTSLSCDH